VYEAYIRLGYSEDFVRASANNWGLGGLELAEAVVLATQEADSVVENRISMEWFLAYREAFERIVREMSPILSEESEEAIERSENTEVSEIGQSFPEESQVNPSPEISQEKAEPEEKESETFTGFDAGVIRALILKEIQELLSG